MSGFVIFLVLTAAFALALGLLAAIATMAIRWASKGSASASFIGWALLLPSAGMNPQPPPQEQVEGANREKKIKKEVGSDKNDSILRRPGEGRTA